MRKKDWFKDRGYPHFTNRTNIRTRTLVKDYISNSENIAKHSFSPLIYKEIIQRRYKLSKIKNQEKRSHKVQKDDKIISNKKTRAILYATHIDAHIYSFYTKKLQTDYENYLLKNPTLSDSITAYRQIETVCRTKYKNNVHFALDIFNEIKQRENCVALAFDVENFFPSLNHKLLKAVWARLLNLKALPPCYYNIFKAVTRFSYVKLTDLKFRKLHFNEKKMGLLKNKGKYSFFEKYSDLFDSGITIYKNQRLNLEKEIIGIPQGLPISALLANIYMLPFDETVVAGLCLKHGAFYRRYSDDIIIICSENQTEEVKSFVYQQIEKIKLSISIPKTEITFFEEFDGRLMSFRWDNGIKKKNIPLNYLGFEFYGYQTLLKSKNIAGFYREMKASVKRKFKRIEVVREKYLEDNPAIFKRKIYRLYSFKGVKSRTINERKYRGNYIRYVYRASQEMNSPEIKRQLRNHWKILQRSIRKNGFGDND